jgi:hypothetical protein
MAQSPIAGGGADLDSLTLEDVRRIQIAADRTGMTITVVGSRTNGSAGPMSDYDHVLHGGTARARHSVKGSLPSGPTGLGEPRNQDFHPERCMMDAIEKLLTDPTNYAILQLPGRKYPSVVFQGDSLHALIAQMQYALAAARKYSDDALNVELEDVLDSLSAAETKLKLVCEAQGLELPWPA